MPRIRLVESACDRCGQCQKACPKKPLDFKIFNCQKCHESDCTASLGACAYNALGKSQLEKRARCDLCQGAKELPCVAACKKRALKLESDFLGWKTFPPLEGEFAVEHEAFCFSQKEEELLKILLSRFRERASDGAEGNAGSELLLEILKEACEEYGFALEKSRAKWALKAAEMNSSGFGVLDLLLHNDELEEISVVGANRKIFVFKKGVGWMRSNCAFSDNASAINAINKMARPLGRRVTFQSPRLNASIGAMRVHASIPPLSEGVELTIRRFSKEPLSIADLVSFNTLSAQAAAFLWLCLQADCSLLVAGNTGSGKTSMLNALLSFVPLSERIVSVEETPELRVLHKHCVKMVANQELGIAMKDLAIDTLRMRPDRVVIGEVRGKEEAEALFDSILAGQARGTYATMHGKSAKDALSRLKSFGVPEHDLDAIDLVLVQRRIPLYDSRKKTQTELRRVVEIAEVENGAAKTLFKYDAMEGKLEQCAKSQVLERLCANYRATVFQLEREWKKREEFLQEASKRVEKEKLGHEQFAQKVQEYLFETK